MNSSYLFAFVCLFAWRNEPFHQAIGWFKTAWGVGISIYVFLFINRLTSFLFDEASTLVASIAVSASWLVYAIAYIGIGKWKTIAPCSVFGILMLFVVLLKVIFIDLPIASFAVQAMLFVGLGGLGLLVSRFLYSNEEKSQ